MCGKKNDQNIYYIGLEKKTCSGLFLDLEGDTWQRTMQQIWKKEGGIEMSTTYHWALSTINFFEQLIQVFSFCTKSSACTVDILSTDVSVDGGFPLFLMAFSKRAKCWAASLWPCLLALYFKHQKIAKRIEQM